jgi:hypothetical protein
MSLREPNPRIGRAGVTCHGLKWRPSTVRANKTAECRHDKESVESRRATQLLFEVRSPSNSAMPLPVEVAFVAGSSGIWRIERIAAVAGESLPFAERLTMMEGQEARWPGEGSWTLRGTTSNARYTNHEELKVLNVKQEMLLRPRATCAALIPIRKRAAWWDLAQDERRAIFEEQSRHIRIGMEYLPAVARRLHHSRELREPFDFLAWFEYAPEHAEAFEEMVSRLRETAEWRYVQREVDIRMSREASIGDLI